MGRFYRWRGCFRRQVGKVGSLQWAVGSWQLAVGSWQLAVGSWQLSESGFLGFEDRQDA
jgi:hypothetical protein